MTARFSAFEAAEEQSKEDISNERDELHFQLFRLQQNIDEIAKKWIVIGIDQRKDGYWMVLYVKDDNEQCIVMAHVCDSAFTGTWDASIHAHYCSDFHIHIDDIRGDPNHGNGSPLMRKFKSYLSEKNIHKITGDIQARDWDHIDRLQHFYEKHSFQIELYKEEKNGTVRTSP